MNDDLLNRARAFSSRYKIELGKELGTGTQGAVFTGIDNAKGGPAAVKFHFREHSFARECAVYRRLSELGLESIRGFNIPKLLRMDTELLAIEMSVVRKPYVLDFAGAWMDEQPEFSDEVLADWERDKIEQFGERWPIVQAIMAEFRSHGIHLLDVSPGNIAFRD